MNHINSHDEYESYVRMVARRTVEMGEDAQTAAEVCVIDTQTVGPAKALLFNAWPFVESGVDHERLWPSEVITYDDREIYPIGWGDGLRELAVASLANDIQAEMDRIRGDGEVS